MEDINLVFEEIGVMMYEQGDIIGKLSLPMTDVEMLSCDWLKGIDTFATVCRNRKIIFTLTDRNFGMYINFLIICMPCFHYVDTTLL